MLWYTNRWTNERFLRQQCRSTKCQHTRVKITKETQCNQLSYYTRGCGSRNYPCWERRYIDKHRGRIYKACTLHQEIPIIVTLPVGPMRTICLSTISQAYRGDRLNPHSMSDTWNHPLGGCTRGTQTDHQMDMDWSNR